MTFILCVKKDTGLYITYTKLLSHKFLAIDVIFVPSKHASPLLSITTEEREPLDSVPDGAVNVHGDYYWDEFSKQISYLGED